MKKNNALTRMIRVITLELAPITALLLFPGYIGWQISTNEVVKESARCQMIEECLVAVETAKPLLYIIFVSSSYVFAFVISVIILIFWLLFKRRRTAKTKKR